MKDKETTDTYTIEQEDARDVDITHTHGCVDVAITDCDGEIRLEVENIPKAIKILRDVLKQVGK